MTDTHTVDRPLAAMPPAVADEWRTWLDRHGIDPDDVAVPGRISRHPARRRITYLAYKRDANGDVVVKPDRSDLVRVEHLAQLEAAPAPFPKLEEDDHG